MNLDDIVAALDGTPVVLDRLVRGLPDETLCAGHDAGTWSIKEVVLHLRDTDEVFLGRFEKMAREDSPFLPGFDQEAYARERNYQAADAAAALTDFAGSRRRMVELFRGLTPADLGRPGTHEEYGPVTIGGMVEHLIAHDISHLAQIARALSSP